MSFELVLRVDFFYLVWQQLQPYAGPQHYSQDKLTVSMTESDWLSLSPPEVGASENFVLYVRCCGMGKGNTLLLFYRCFCDSAVPKVTYALNSSVPNTASQHTTSAQLCSPPPPFYKLSVQLFTGQLVTRRSMTHAHTHTHTHRRTAHYISTSTFQLSILLTTCGLDLAAAAGKIPRIDGIMAYHSSNVSCDDQTNIGYK